MGSQDSKRKSMFASAMADVIRFNILQGKYDSQYKEHF